MPKNFFEQFDQMDAPKIVLNEVKKNSDPKEKLKKIKYNDPTSKAAMIAQLQDILKQLPYVSSTCLQTDESQPKDTIIQQLKDLQKRAIALNYPEIQKLCILAIGKRILNIELKKKRQQHKKKQKKKSQIQGFFRENRIKKFDYDSLIETKLLQNTLIVRPYSSGKGFIQSGNDYTDMQDALTECDYINVVREVNRIFFDIFSGKRKDGKSHAYDILFKLIWINVGMFLALLISLPYYTFYNEQIILYILLGIIALLLTIITISTYANVPNNNNQMQQSIEDTKAFFDELNDKNNEQGKQYEWRCGQNFMYLQVRFDYNILEKYKSLDG